MYRTCATVEGMMCKMCEAHVEDAVRKAFPVKRVSASHSANRLTILSETPLDEAALRRTIEETGYRIGEVACAPEAKTPSLLSRLFRRG